MAPPRTLPRGNCPHCGKEFPLQQRLRKFASGPHRVGDLMGHMPQKYCSRSCSNAARGKGYIDKNGYRIISLGSRKAGQRAEHIVVMEKVLGRKLLPTETVHHKNGIRNDNRPENLELWSGRHGKGQRVADHIEFAKEMLAIYGEGPFDLSFIERGRTDLRQMFAELVQP
jgi:hypothetical protein